MQPAEPLPALAGTFGRSDITALGFGTVPLVYSSRSHVDRLDVLQRVLDGEPCFVDTADVYSRVPGAAEAEEMLGGELRGRPDRRRHIIGTKCGFVADHAGVRPSGRPYQLMRAADRSLRRLGVEAIDVLFLHTVDPEVPFAESLGALANLVDSGKARSAGLSNVSVTQIREGRRVLGRRFVCVQNRLDLGTTGQEDVLDECRTAGLAFLAAAPLGGMGHRRSNAGWYRAAEQFARDPWNAEQVALNTMLARWPEVLPIVGVSSAASLLRWEALNQLYENRQTGQCPVLEIDTGHQPVGTSGETGVHR